MYIWSSWERGWSLRTLLLFLRRVSNLWRAIIMHRAIGAVAIAAITTITTITTATITSQHYRHCQEHHFHPNPGRHFLTQRLQREADLTVYALDHRQSWLWEHIY